MLFKFWEKGRNRRYDPRYLITFNMEHDGKFDAWVLTERFLRKSYYKHLGTFNYADSANKAITSFDCGE